MSTVTVTRTWHYGHDLRTETFTAPTMTEALALATPESMTETFADEAHAALSNGDKYRGWSWYTFSARATRDGDALASVMDFDHVVRITPEGDIRPAPHTLPAPDCEPEDLNAVDYSGWTLITSGLTGQHGYRGPWLHDSEQIAGGVAQRVFDHAAENGGGLYVAVYATYPPAELDGESVIEGWAIAYRPAVCTPAAPDFGTPNGHKMIGTVAPWCVDCGRNA